MKRVLVIGPDVGMEFGWKLQWQTIARKTATYYDDAYVITTPDCMFMYEDFARPYTEMTERYKPNMFRFDDCDVTYMHPEPNNTKNAYVAQGKAIRFGEKDARAPQCIVLHARKKNDGREWPYDTWVTFVEKLKKVVNIPIMDIGTLDASYRFHGVLVGYQSDFGGSHNILANAKLCIGPSSGAMHLASMCGCPHLVWTDNKKWNLGGIAGTNRQRYELLWNPLKTKVRVIDQYGWQPEPNIILKETLNFLGELSET
jgi:hypothetical protein